MISNTLDKSLVLWLQLTKPHIWRSSDGIDVWMHYLLLLASFILPTYPWTQDFYRIRYMDFTYSYSSYLIFIYLLLSLRIKYLPHFTTKYNIIISFHLCYPVGKRLRDILTIYFEKCISVHENIVCFYNKKNIIIYYYRICISLFYNLKNGEELNGILFLYNRHCTIVRTGCSLFVNSPLRSESNNSQH